MDVSERIGSGELVRMRIDTGDSPDPNTDLDDEALWAAAGGDYGDISSRGTMSNADLYRQMGLADPAFQEDDRMSDIELSALRVCAAELANDSELSQ